MKRLLVGGAILALGVAGMAQSQAAPSRWNVTGGGQIIASTADPSEGPGATLAFQAQGDAAAARGNLQYNDHAGAKFHGQVTCIKVLTEDTDDSATAEDMQRVAYIAGTYDNGTADGGFFKLYVEDRDFGGPQNGVETLAFDPEASDDSCDNYNGSADLELGRGNVVIHKEKAPKEGI